MSDVFLEREFEQPMTPARLAEMGASAGRCLGMHRVDWHSSLIALGGRRMLCRFRAPDAESARLALRQSGADIRRMWPGTVHEAPQPCEAQPNVLVERSFARPVTLESVQSLEDAGAWCMETHRIRFVRTYFSLDRRRMLCLYHAPDAESVRLAQEESGMPLERVWAFQAFDSGS